MAGKSDNKAPAPIQLVSIGVVAYNEEKTLDDILNDIKAQDYPHNRIEILLVDSDSADGTRIVMEAFANASKGDFPPSEMLILKDYFTNPFIYMRQSFKSVLLAVISFVAGPVPAISKKTLSFSSTALITQTLRL